MRANFVCFKLSKTMIVLASIIVIQLILIIFGIKEIREMNSFEEISNTVSKENKITNQVNNEQEKIIEEANNDETAKNEELNTDNQEIKLEEYKNMPRELKGYKVIGKIQIPKVKLSTYILAETNKKSLKVSVTKLCGPEINKVGNFCIAGHNYINNKMFGGIKKLKIGDEIILTDTYDREVKYQVYDSYKTSPKDVSCLDGETGGEREITLITCTAGAIQRVIVKAIEIYD